MFANRFSSSVCLFETMCGCVCVGSGPCTSINKFSVLLIMVFRSTNRYQLVCMCCCATYLSWLIVSFHNFHANNIIIISRRYRTLPFAFIVIVGRPDRLKIFFILVSCSNGGGVFSPVSVAKAKWKMTHQFVNNISSTPSTILTAQRQQQRRRRRRRLKQHPVKAANFFAFHYFNDTCTE